MTPRRRIAAALFAVTIPVTAAAAPSRAAAAPFACETVAVSPAFSRDHTAACVYRPNNVDPRVLAVTTNGGRSWRKPAMSGLTRPDGPVGVALSVAFSPAYVTDSALLATTASGTFVSTDRGETFTVVDSLVTAGGLSNPLFYLAGAPSALAPVTGSGKRVYLVYAAGYRSARTDVAAKVHLPVIGVPGGETVRFALPQTDAPFALAYESDPATSARTLSTYGCTAEFACTQKLFSFPRDVQFPAPGDERVQVVGGTTVIVVLVDGARDTHVWRSTDSGATFSLWAPVEKLLAPVNRTSESYPYVAVGFDPARPKQLLLRVSGRKAHGGWAKDAPPAEQLFRSDNGGASWSRTGYQRGAFQAGPRGSLPWNGPAMGADPAGIYPASDGVTVFAVGDFVSSGEAAGNVRTVYCSRDRGVHWQRFC